MEKDTVQPYLIFTDLDGTLLDHNDYTFDEALPALDRINQYQIPLILNSSKTQSENQYDSERLAEHLSFCGRKRCGGDYSQWDFH